MGATHVEWIDPWQVLGLDIGADHDEVVAAYRRFAREHHPDRVGDVSPAEQAAAAERMARANHAYELLTDTDAARAHRQQYLRLKSTGHAPEAPARPARRAPPPSPRRAPATPSSSDPASSHGTPEQRQRAAGEFPPSDRGRGTPWTARGSRRRGRFRRR